MKTILRIGIVVVLLCLIAFPIQAQDKEKTETPYWYVSHFKIPWVKIDSLYIRASTATRSAAGSIGSR